MSLHSRLLRRIDSVRQQVREQMKKEEAWPTIQRARDLLADGPEDETSEFLEAAVERFPDNAELRLLNGFVLARVNPEDGIHEAARAIELAPYEPWYLIRAAWLM